MIGEPDAASVALDQLSLPDPRHRSPRAIGAPRDAAGLVGEKLACILEADPGDAVRALGERSNVVQAAFTEQWLVLADLRCQVSEVAFDALHGFVAPAADLGLGVVELAQMRA